MTGTRKRKNNSVKKQVFDKVSRDDSDDDVKELGDDDDDDDNDGLDVDQEYYDSLECEDEDDICCEMEEEEKGSVSSAEMILLEAIWLTTYSFANANILPTCHFQF